MKKIEYTYSGYHDLLKVLAKNFALKIKDNQIIVPSDKGNGQIMCTVLPNGLQVLVFNCSFNEEVLYHRKKSNNNFFIFGIEVLNNEGNKAKPSLYFGQASSEWIYLAPAGTLMNNINILLPIEWLENLFLKESASDILIANLLYHNTGNKYELIDAEYSNLISDILSANNLPGFENIIIQNRVMLILERFFSRQLKKIEQSNSPINANAYEMERLKLIETAMLKDLSFTPPNLTQLARIGAMSVSRLKMLFKKVYGIPPYQFYQKYRMQKGKAMLLSKKYSLRQIASELGYIHLGDFSKAFKKHFDQFPEELLS